MKTLAKSGNATKTKKSFRSAENSIIVKTNLENKTNRLDRYNSTKITIDLFVNDINIHKTIYKT